METTAEKHSKDFVIGRDDLILITGATGFIGSRVVRNLRDLGFRNLRCLVRPSSEASRIEALTVHRREEHVEVFTGNLLSAEDCSAVTKDAAVIVHLAAARGEKSFPDAFLNSVVTTRNLLEACLHRRCLRRFVNISSFSVYTNTHKAQRRLLDEDCTLEPYPASRGDAYSFAKIKQDQLVTEYGERFGIPYVIVRPGYVHGLGNEGITGRVGINTFGVFLHLGGSNQIPFTYVDNCADAIVMAALKTGIDGETFNVVDDDLPSSRQFLRLYKQNVRKFHSFYVPHALSYLLCYLWERYSDWSEGQLPPVFNRKHWHVYWKNTRYSNAKLKNRLGWTPKVAAGEALRLYFESCRRRHQHA